MKKNNEKKIRLSRYLKPYWLLALMSPISMFLEVGMDILLPTMMARIVNEGVLKGDIKAIIAIGIWMLGLSVLGGIGGLAAAGFASAASQNFGADLRNDMYKKVLSLSYSQHDRFSVGSLVTRLTNDVTQVENFVSEVLRMFFRSPLLFIGSIIMVLRLDVRYGIVILIALPLEALAVWLMISKTSPLYDVAQERLDKLNAVIQENVVASRVVKVFVREEREIARFTGANNDLTDTTLTVQRITSALMPVMTIIMNASVIAVLWLSGARVEDGSLLVGNVMAVVNYLTTILMNMMMLSMIFNSVARGKVSAARIREVLSEEAEITAPEGATADVTDGAIRFENVSFSYFGMGGDPVLSDINMDIRPGEIIGVMGATGSGKSSLANLIPRLYDTTGGRVLVDGVDVKDYDPAVLRRRVGMILQKSELFSGTIKDNILWGNDGAGDEEMVEAAITAQADGFIRSFPDGYDTIIGQKGSSVSGGQKQRIAIARGLLKKPKIFILDDASSALDLATEANLRKAIREKMAGMTVIIIASRVASVRDADRIAVLDNGRLVGFDSHENLMNTCRVYKDINDSQMRGGEING